MLALKLDGPDNHADLRLPPLALADWWAQLDHADGPTLAVPPVSGHAEIARIDTGNITIEGLTMQAGSNVPASATSAAAPAPTAPIKAAPAKAAPTKTASAKSAPASTSP